MISPASFNTSIEAPHDDESRPEPEQSPSQVEPIFVGTLIFIVLSVVIEYILGDFVGLNAGEDFGLVLGGAIIFGICAGMVAGALHDWSKRAKHR